MFLQGQYSVTGDFSLTFNSCSATLVCSNHLWTYVHVWGCNGTEDMHPGRSKFKLPPSCHYNSNLRQEREPGNRTWEEKEVPCCSWGEACCLLLIRNSSPFKQVSVNFFKNRGIISGKNIKMTIDSTYR